METKKPQRRSRIHRSPKPANINPTTDRVISILDILYHHRLAETGVFTSLLAGSEQRIIKGLRYPLQI